MLIFNARIVKKTVRLSNSKTYNLLDDFQLACFPHICIVLYRDCSSLFTGYSLGSILNNCTCNAIPHIVTSSFLAYMEAMDDASD